MNRRVAIVGAGVSGLTCATLFAQRGFAPMIFADEIGNETNSAAAAAIWFPYDVGPGDAVLPLSFATRAKLVQLMREPAAGVSMIELRIGSRLGPLAAPAWAKEFGARNLETAELPPDFPHGFALDVPLVETGKYLEYLQNGLTSAGLSLQRAARFRALEEVPRDFDLILNCTGIGARELTGDENLEPHRGQVALVAKIDLPYAFVCDDPPLTYAIPRASDCVLGGTNEISRDRAVDPATTARLVAEFERALKISAPKLLAAKVGLRPYRKSGVRLAAETLRDGRRVIHNYGHGGAGFTLSWGLRRKSLRARANLTVVRSV